jgi:hypothetical protein
MYKNLRNIAFAALMLGILGFASPSYAEMAGGFPGIAPTFSSDNGPSIGSGSNSCLAHGSCKSSTLNGMYCVTCSAKNHMTGRITTGKNCKSAGATTPTDQQVENNAEAAALRNCGNGTVTAPSFMAD